MESIDLNEVEKFEIWELARKACGSEESPMAT